jgi:predicted neuraminidase
MTIRLSISALILCCLISPHCAITAQPAPQTLADPHIVALADGVERPGEIPGTTSALLPILYPSSHASNLLPLKNGDLLCFWFSGTWEGDSEVGIVMSRLPKGSHRWTPTVLIDRHVGESYQNPAAFQAPDGTVHLYHTTQLANQGEANSRVLELSSSDNGKTWKGPEVLFDKPGSYTRHPPLALPNGWWLMPLNYQTSAGIGAGAETNYSAVKISSDGGKSWKECAMPGSEGKVQPSIVQAAPDHLIAFFRSRAADFIFRSDSPDGCTWSKPQPTVLPNNNASVQALRLRNGHIVIVFDNSSDDRTGPKRIPGLRKPLAIALSDDEGATWKHIRDIETGRPGLGASEGALKQPGREEYSYPSVKQAADGSIFVAFTFRRQTIKVVSFSEDWIAKGGTTGKVKGTGSPQ